MTHPLASTIRTVAELEALYEVPAATSIAKEVDHLTDLHRAYDPAELSPVGRIMEAITEGAFDGKAFDDSYPGRVRQTIY